MNEFNVLLNAATSGTPSGSLFDALFARYIAPQESWREIESPLPITILTAGEDLIDYRIYGNTEQTGTPTPENPIMPSGCGERTENLFDKDSVLEHYYLNNGVPTIYNSGGYVLSDYIPIVSSTATISARVTTPSSSGAHWAVYDENKTFIRGGLTFLAMPASTTKVNVVDTSGAAFVRVDFATDFLTDCILNLGSTAPSSYIPYGYKLPMVVRSRNLFDKDSTPYALRNYISSNNELVSAGGFDVTDFIDVNGNKDYYLSNVNVVSYKPAICFYDANKEFISGVAYVARASMQITTPENCKYVRLSVGRHLYDSAMLTEGSTAPASYIPYYRDEENICIGSDPLAEDEYVDFGEQKIYKRTENLFDGQGTDNYGYYNGFNGKYVDDKNYKHWRIPVKEGDIIRWTYTGAGTGCLFYKGNYVTYFLSNASPFTIPSGVDEITDNFTSSVARTSMVTKNQPIPSSYVPYLEPTDPPVAIPTLPTIDGETIIDYNPSTTPAVEPEKMYIKYKPQ